MESQDTYRESNARARAGRQCRVRSTCATSRTGRLRRAQQQFAGLPIGSRYQDEAAALLAVSKRSVGKAVALKKHDWSGQFRLPQPCGNCGRPVFRYLRHKRKETVFCSEKCQRAIYNTRARLKRVRDPRRCLKCGRPFVPSRTGSKYC